LRLYTNSCNLFASGDWYNCYSQTKMRALGVYGLHIVILLCTCSLLVTLTSHFLNSSSKVFVTSLFKCSNQIPVGGTSTIVLLPFLQSSSPVSDYNDLHVIF
jgi:hypothetical protein